MPGNPAHADGEAGGPPLIPVCASCGYELATLKVQIEVELGGEMMTMEDGFYKWAPYLGVYLVSPGRLKWLLDPLFRSVMTCRCPICQAPAEMALAPNVEDGSHAIEPTMEQRLAARL